MMRGIGTEFADEPLDRRMHCCREKERLMVVGKCAEDVFHVLGEAHVEHAIRFIEDCDFDRREVERASFDVVDEATRGADDDVGAMAK